LPMWSGWTTSKSTIAITITSGASPCTRPIYSK
jgi:hypothetical protein